MFGFKINRKGTIFASRVRLQVRSPKVIIGDGTERTRLSCTSTAIIRLPK